MLPRSGLKRDRGRVEASPPSNSSLYSFLGGEGDTSGCTQELLAGSIWDARFRIQVELLQAALYLLYYHFGPFLTFKVLVGK